jgi:hypothetical protein
MTWKASVLVIANVTAASDDLLDSLLKRAARGHTSFTLLVPASDASPRAQEAAAVTLARALERMRDAGLQADGRVGDPDPMIAAQETFDPRLHDEIVVSTLPSGASKWLQIDLPHRIGRLTGAPVTHVVARPPVVLPSGVAPPERARQGVLSPLRSLSWGAGRHA